MLPRLALFSDSLSCTYELNPPTLMLVRAYPNADLLPRAVRVPSTCIFLVAEIPRERRGGRIVLRRPRHLNAP